MSDRLMRIGVVLGAVACMAFAVSCGGGGGGGGGGGTDVAMQVSFPAASAKPDGAAMAPGDVVGTDAAGATATLTTDAGRVYSMTDNGDGTYSVRVPTLSDGESFLIEARKGTAEMSSLVTNLTVSGQSRTFDAGVVDVQTTALSEIVREVANSLSGTVDLAGDVRDADTGTVNLMRSWEAFAAEVDVLQLVAEIMSAQGGSAYAQMADAIMAAVEAGDVNDTTTTESTLRDGTTVDRDAAFAALSDGSVSIPAPSADSAAAFAAAQDMIIFYSSCDNTSDSSDLNLQQLQLASSFLHNGSSGADFVTGFDTQCAADLSGGVATRRFAGSLLMLAETSDRFKVGMVGTWEGLNSGGTVVEWSSVDARATGRDFFYVDRDGSDWRVAGNQQYQTSSVTYHASKYWTWSCEPDTTAGGSYQAVNFLMVQGVNSFNSGYAISTAEVQGASVFTSPTSLTGSAADDGGTSWTASQSVATAPATDDSVGFLIVYASTDNTSDSTNFGRVTSVGSVGGLNLTSFDEGQKSASIGWTAPAVDAQVSSITVTVYCGMTGDVMSSSQVKPGTRSTSVATSGLTDGYPYTIVVTYADVYGNTYSVEKDFYQPYPDSGDEPCPGKASE